MHSKSTLFLIVVHNKKIIDLFESTNKYNKLINYKYLLVGNQITDFSNEKIIQCDRLPYNIEDKQHYLAYTGWYAAAKNPEIVKDYDYICFLEYDTDFDDNFSLENFVNHIYKEQKKCYGIASLDTKIGFLQKSPFSEKLISFLIRENLTEIKSTSKKWIVTNNAVFQKQFLIDYFNDTLTQDLLIYLNNDVMSGHFLERYLTTYCFVRGIKFGLIDDCHMHHKALDSHGTQNRKFGPEGYERFKAFNKISD